VNSPLTCKSCSPFKRVTCLFLLSIPSSLPPSPQMVQVVEGNFKIANRATEDPDVYDDDLSVSEELKADYSMRILVSLGEEKI
jgi:hypothetical protein